MKTNKESFEELSGILSDSIKHLIAARNIRGHWDEIKHSGMAVWALHECLRSFDLPQDASNSLKRIISETEHWLFNKAKKEKEVPGINWESEVWDSSIVIIALAYDESYYNTVLNAKTYLKDIIDQRTGVWYHDVWETVLATIAILRIGRFNKIREIKEDWTWLDRVLKWIVDIPSKPNGEFISPHLSGFILWLLGEIDSHPSRENIKAFPSFKKFQTKTEKTLNWIIKEFNKKDSHIWSYIYALSYIIIGLCNIGYQLKPNNIKSLLINLKENQTKDGGFEEIEDTALAVIAISLLLGKKGISNALVRRFNKSLIPKKKCFIGYYNKRRHLYKEIDRHIKKTLPEIELVDWRFRSGSQLFDEIKNACSGCNIAIFLMTKDQFKSLPRGNIIFEYGYFSAHLGQRNTIMIVEPGTQIPSDLNGIIYISMESNNRIGNAKFLLENELKAILGV